MAAFDHSSHATRGARNYQEDTALIWPIDSDAKSGADGAASVALASGSMVAVLADGMGGHAGGALASRLACESFVAAYKTSAGEVRDRLMESLAAANKSIAEQVAMNPVLSGMGSTLVGVAFGPDGVQWVSVGDSPLLLYRRGEVAHLNEDHSLAPELDRLAKMGRITVEEARRDPRRHMLRSAVTGEDIDLIDISAKPLKIEPGDYVILSSDGLQTLETGEIERIVSAYAADGADAVARALIREVESVRAPHQDNATVIAVRALARAPAEEAKPAPDEDPVTEPRRPVENT